MYDDCEELGRIAAELASMLLDQLENIRIDRPRLLKGRNDGACEHDALGLVLVTEIVDEGLP